MSPSAESASQGTAGPAPVASGIGWSGAIALALIVALFAAVRFAALFNDLWMDEIWSIKVINQLGSPLEVFTRYLQANNHPLSSLWLYAVFPAKADWIYRLLSWATGSTSVALAGAIAVRQFKRAQPDASTNQLRAAALIAATLFGSCYFLIVYSSEARGYAPALGFSLLAFYALIRSGPRSSKAWIFVYWMACALALLSHAASAQVILVALLWSIVQAIHQRNVVKVAFLRLVAWHAVPLASCAVYFGAFLRRLTISGAPELSVRQAMGELAAYTFGFPSPDSAWLALPLIGVAALAALWPLWRRAPVDAVFYAALIFSAPLAALVAGRFAVLFPRYFIFGSAWSLLLMAYPLALLWGKGRVLRVVSFAVIALFVLGNTLHTIQLLRHGRGEYQAALRYIAEHTRTPDITLCSDHDNRNFMLIDYYAARSAPGRRMLYLTGNRTTNERPQWLLVHRLDGLSAPDSSLNDDRGNAFQFEKRFPHAPLSGWDWFVFRNLREGP